MLPRSSRITIGLLIITTAATRPAPAPGHAAHRAVQHQHRKHALDHLRQHQRPDVEAEDAQGQRLHKDRARQLVDRRRWPTGRPRRRGSCAGSSTCCRAAPP